MLSWTLLECIFLFKYRIFSFHIFRPSLLGHPQKDCKAWGSVNGAELNHSRDSFRERCLLCCTWTSTYTVEGYQHYLRLDSECSNHQGFEVRKRRCGECRPSADQLQVAHTTSEFSALTSGNTHGGPCFLFRGTVGQVDWSPGHACIFSHGSKLQVAKPKEAKLCLGWTYHTSKPTALTSFLILF